MRPTLNVMIGLGLFLGLGCLIAGSYAQPGSPPLTPAEMLPESTVLYLRLDGTHGHEETYAETAAYEAIEESGLKDVFQEFLNSLSEQEELSGLVGVYEHLAEYGFSLAIAVDAPEAKPVQAWGTIVVPLAGEGVNLLESLVIQLSEEKLEVKATKVRKRDIRYVDWGNPTLELAWWSEGEDLILALGMNGIANTLDVIEGKRPNITTHRLWEQYTEVDEGLDVTQLGWFDAESLRNSFSHVTIPTPNKDLDEPLTVGRLMEILGLQNLDHTAALSGYLGNSIWSEVIIHAPGERTGLLSLLDQEPFTVEDLPPIPLHQQGITVASFDWSKAYQVGTGIVRELAAYGSPRELEQFEQALAQLEQTLGFAPETLLDSLGSLNCLYSDASQGIFGSGFGFVGLVQVEDQEALESCLKKIAQRLTEEVDRSSPGALHVEILESEGRQNIRFNLPRVPFITPTLSFDENWLIIGLNPQSVDAQIMRFDERIYSWAIDQDLAESLELLPDEMTSLSVLDPAVTTKSILAFAPGLIGLMELGMRENGTLPPGGRLPIDIHSIPPAELVTQSLFPNVSASTVDENGLHAYSRQSMPGIPLVGGSGVSASGVGVAAVGVALLLPAVQNARYAARMAQSKNNLKHMALAVHNYADTNGSLPPGTVPNESLDPEEQLSFFTEILHFIGETALSAKIDRKAAWNADANEKSLSQPVQIFLNPNQPDSGSGSYGKTNYVGIAGWGEAAPHAPVTDPNAGVFGYGRVTRFRDITDGTSNTLMITESTKVTNWGEGGPATIRPFTAKPYVNGPDGIGSPLGMNFNAAFVDGYVRTINSDIDPEVLKAITTIAGGEIPGEF